MRPARLVSGVALIAFGVLFAVAFYDRYWRWRDCFNKLGRCYDPAGQDVYLEQSGLIWGGLAAICLVAGVVLLIRRRSLR